MGTTIRSFELSSHILSPSFVELDEPPITQPMHFFKITPIPVVRLSQAKSCEVLLPALENMVFIKNMVSVTDERKGIDNDHLMVFAGFHLK
jgi:hypothetical protein